MPPRTRGLEEPGSLAGTPLSTVSFSNPLEGQAGDQAVRRRSSDSRRSSSGSVLLSEPIHWPPDRLAPSSDQPQGPYRMFANGKRGSSSSSRLSTVSCGSALDDLVQLSEFNEEEMEGDDVNSEQGIVAAEQPARSSAGDNAAPASIASAELSGGVEINLPPAATAAVVEALATDAALDRENAARVAPFVTKLFEIASSFPDAIEWSADGKSIVIKNSKVLHWPL